jgi:HEAT repeat protein
MRMPPAGSAGRAIVAALVTGFLVCPTAARESQPSLDQTIRDLGSTDPGVRLHAVQLIKRDASPEAAAPLAALLTDREGQIRLEAVAGELNIFLAHRVVPQRRVGLLIEVRQAISAEAAFTAGPLIVGSRAVPREVLAALQSAARDRDPRIGLEALYAFGALASSSCGAARAALLGQSGPDLASLIGAADPAFRFAALRIIGRLFERRPADPPTDESVGDAVIAALNDGSRTISGLAMEALGAMRYERSVDALTDLYRYFERGDGAALSLDALAHIAHPSSGALFATALAGRNEALKGIAIEGLARIGDRSKAAAIQAALDQERSEHLRLAGQFAAVRLSDAPPDALAAALTQPNLHDQARRYLIEIAPGRMPAFAPYSHSPDARVRAEIADVLGLAGDSAALAIVEPMTKDDNPEVALAAERAVRRLCSP